MSRTTVFKTNRIEVVMGVDHMLGQFIQMYDNNFSSETPEGEGLILDWSEAFGFKTNLTGISNVQYEEKYEKYIKDWSKDMVAMFITIDYVKQEEPEEYVIELGKGLEMIDTYRKTLMN